MMTAVNYSTVKYELTEGLRQLELLSNSLQNKESKFVSEVDYWISSIELIRQCLYNCTNEYEDAIELDVSISEIKSEIYNAYLLQHSWLTETQQNKLRLAWLRLEKAEGHLK